MSPLQGHRTGDCTNSDIGASPYAKLSAPYRGRVKVISLKMSDEPYLIPLKSYPLSLLSLKNRDSHSAVHKRIAGRGLHGGEVRTTITSMPFACGAGRILPPIPRKHR